MLLKIILAYLIMIKFILLGQFENCSDNQEHKKKFYLIKAYHRSLEERFFMDNVQTLEECIELAIQYKGLALNYAPRKRFKHLYRAIFIESKISRDHFWNQPQLHFNCHILRCPENTTMKTLVNDSAFNYYSMYRPPLASTHYVCLPEVGLFFLQTMPETFENASWNCRYAYNFCGSLPHVASNVRTNALTKLLIEHNNAEQVTQSKVYLAYVGLHYNRSLTNKFKMLNMAQESLKCFLYRAWEPGNPKRNQQFVNSSCVALTTHRTWKTVSCKKKLPYICEILTTCAGAEKGNNNMEN